MTQVLETSQSRQTVVLAKRLITDWMATSPQTRGNGGGRPPCTKLTQFTMPSASVLAAPKTEIEGAPDLVYATQTS